ncbi:META domain-containing protein [Campylobacter jejuni]|nr:META domain-containing protein [Campylobacter jejuni]EAH7731425.1 META domain-containing protein [Campylobacter jejuni]EAI2691820.1 META domain-containing protein [Campylobacter jejuni]EAL4171343.1 META domain-containing protein [Campylobacter jejuni]EFN6289410.1 META domain-containing protein [Campylobacter jejuni]
MKKTLQIALAAAFFTGCASTSVTSSTSKGNNELVQNQLFKIEKIIVNGKTFDPKNAEESPNISFENNKFYGYSGCNRFFGSYQTKADTLQIEGDRVASTQMLCHPMDVMDFENSFLSNFKGTFKISNENGKLVLSNDEMKVFFK